jgi:hypothetical protein
MDQASHASGSLDGPRPFAERAVWTYLFTICEYFLERAAGGVHQRDIGMPRFVQAERL